MRRRDVLKVLTAAAIAGVVPRIGSAAEGDELYDIGKFGNARVLHMTDTHAQLSPVYFREPSVNLGIGDDGRQAAASGRRGVSQAFRHRPEVAARPCFYLSRFRRSRAPLRPARRLRAFKDADRPPARRCRRGPLAALDGGDLWQGSGLANIMQGEDMVDAANLLGIEAMAAHWEFTYGEERLRANIKSFKGEFLAQNVFLTEEAAFDNKPAFDSASGRAFKPATIKEVGGFRIGVIGQALPYVPIAHPKRFTPDWTFGIREPELQKLVDGLRHNDKVDAVILLSHNGMDLDSKLASRVTGIDVVLGGHTHDAVPQPISIANQAVRRWLPMAARAANSSACSTSSSARVRSRMCAITCCRSIPGC